MKKDPAPATPANTVQKEVLTLEARIRLLEQNVTAMKTQVSTLLNNMAQLNLAIGELTKYSVSPKNYQAVVVNPNVAMFAVSGNADNNGDKFTSVEEAVKAAERFIQERGLSDNYRASVIPVW